MVEYIDRAKIGLNDFEIIMCDGDYREALKMLLQKIQDIPAADVQPVKHGRWSGYFCSNCGISKYNFISFNFDDQNGYARPFGTWLYCPRCGARMDGGA